LEARQGNERVGRDRSRLLVRRLGGLTGPDHGSFERFPFASSHDPAGSPPALTASSYVFPHAIGTHSRMARERRTPSPTCRPLRGARLPAACPAAQPLLSIRCSSMPLTMASERLRTSSLR
jgi:hypothetical protein